MHHKSAFERCANQRYEGNMFCTKDHYFAMSMTDQRLWLFIHNTIMVRKPIMEASIQIEIDFLAIEIVPGGP